MAGWVALNSTICLRWQRVPKGAMAGRGARSAMKQLRMIVLKIWTRIDLSKRFLGLHGCDKKNLAYLFQFEDWSKKYLGRFNEDSAFPNHISNLKQANISRNRRKAVQSTPQANFLIISLRGIAMVSLRLGLKWSIGLIISFRRNVGNLF